MLEMEAPPEVLVAEVVPEAVEVQVLAVIQGATMAVMTVEVQVIMETAAVMTIPHHLPLQYHKNKFKTHMTVEEI